MTLTGLLTLDLMGLDPIVLVSQAEFDALTFRPDRLEMNPGSFPN